MMNALSIDFERGFSQSQALVGSEFNKLGVNNFEYGGWTVFRV